MQHDYQPKDSVKMDGKVQTSYPRKNWSSCMLFNCGHPSTRQLTPELVNRETGAYLHRMQWAADDEIGALPTEYNWLEGWNEKPASGLPKVVHYTRGGPWFGLAECRLCRFVARGSGCDRAGLETCLTSKKLKLFPRLKVNGDHDRKATRHNPR